ncbi:hypothetical protein KVR01_002095 [Diaporthe batatas]|uniref:uncharacterized protein n=1 Tax=Diaporthe batatas TaxID=748121 RepID=UPI001D03E558|nr:uncharacterized protein KVR01_002095 [Diaporthe batatas]KAG8166406.1 hypothetical protein KVR01_002095 [Diaporthe batatas]
MHSTHILKLLVAALSANTLTQGFIIDAAILNRHGIELARRQGLVGDALNNAADAVTGSGGAAVTTTSEESTPTTATAAEETTSTTSRETTATSTSQDSAPTTSENAPSPTTTSSGDTPAPSTTAGGTAATTLSSETTSSGASTSATTTAEPITSTTVVVVTATDGSVSSSTSVSVSTPTPGLSEANSNGSSGMPESTKKTIIGVVVGVGGAIVLAVAGLFAWRIWGRKKANEENDGLMSYNNGAEGKSEVGGLNAGSTVTGSARSPFQSTLESYHAPSNVNASSNF